MGYQNFACGCCICTSMFGNRPVLGVWYCSEHAHMLDEQQSLDERAAVLRETVLSELRLAQLKEDR